MVSVVDIGEGRRMIDLDFRDEEGLVAAYLLPEEAGWSLIETGPTSCRDALLAGLARAGVDPAEVRHVFLTHIHLDHAGGVGALADALPSAMFYAHEIGVPHLVDPARLIASARRTWGAAADPLWGPIVPVASSRIEGLRGGERFPLREGQLQVLATPGHAKHHLSFFDTRLKGIFTGDSAGVRLPNSWRSRPAVPPPDLDLPLLLASLEAMRRLDPRVILYSHFGPSAQGRDELEEYRRTVLEWTDVALEAARERPEVDFIARKLRAHEESREASAGADRRLDERASLVSAYEMAAMGFLRHFQTSGRIPGARA